jgi:pimeloyl-ACP methyl ester carboxylesterase
MPDHVSLKPSIVLLVCLLCAGLLNACSSTAAQTEEQPLADGIALQDCHLSSPGTSLRLPARCGTLSVAENPDDPAGRQINLRIALIPAVSRNPAPDPLFFITGGPGQAASESYPLVSYAFDRLNQKRDIVLVDQRGTGGSNPLDCEPVEGEEDLDLNPELLNAYLQTCLASLDADPRFYSTSIAVADLEIVRQAFGYPQINLYGLSYGTRVALEYLRRYPDRVRTIVLDGIVPPQEALGDNVAEDAQNALNLIFERCQQDTACSKSFPQVRQEFDQLLEQLKSDPVSVNIADPVSGENLDITFTPERLGVAVRLLTYAPETVALLPLLIHTAASAGDFKLVAAQYLIIGGDLGRSVSQAMGYSVLCAEDAPFYDPAKAVEADQNTYLGDQQIQAIRDVCQTWPVGEIPVDFKQPVVSNVPALLLSGEVDPVTPPENAELVSQGLANSLHLVAAGQGHNVVVRGCLPRVTTDFIEQGSTTNLVTGCVSSIQPAPFFVNFSGPLP